MGPPSAMSGNPSTALISLASAHSIGGKVLGFAKSLIARHRFAIPDYRPRQSVPASSRSPRGHEIRYAGVAGVRHWDDGVGLRRSAPMQGDTHRLG